jgi:O-antigen/teichoic acid export membrane protein
MTSRRPNILKNYILNAILTSLNIIYPLITYPWVNRVLGPEKIGLIGWANSIASYFILIAGLGIPIFGVREIAKFQNDERERRQVLSSLVGTSIVASSLCTALFIALASFSSKMSPEIYLFLIISISIFINAFSVDWFFMGVENYKFITIRSIAVKLITLVFLFSFVREKEDYIVYALISVVATSGANLINILSLVHSGELRRVRFFNVLSVVKKAGVLFLISLSISVYMSGNITVLGYLASEKEVGFFTTAFKILQLSLSFLAALVGVLLPRLSNTYQTEDKDEFYRTFSKGLDGALRLALPMFLGMFILADDIVQVIGGDEFAESVPILKLLAPIVLISGLSNFVTNLVFIATGQERRVLVASIVGGIFCIGLDMVFIPKWGGFGAAVAFFIAEIAILVFYGFIIEADFRKIVLKSFIGKHALGVTAMAVAVYLVKEIPLRSLYSLLISILTGVVIYCSSMFVMRDKIAVELVGKVFGKRRHGAEV